MINKPMQIMIPDLDGNMLLSAVDSLQDIRGGLLSMEKCRIYVPVLYSKYDYESIKMLESIVDDQDRVYPCIMEV